MKKSLIFILLFTLILANPIITTLAQTVPALPGLTGELDESGMPKEFSDFKASAEKLSEEEQREEYLQQEWTKLMANKKVIGPFLFYTNKFFRFFNPFWKVVFGVEFTWSWAFFFSFGIFLLLALLIYDPLTSFLNFSTLPKILTTLAFVTLVGISGGIRIIIDYLSAMISGWLSMVIAVLIAFIIGIVYHKLMMKFSEGYREKQKKLEKEAEERRAEKGRALEKIQNAKLGIDK